MNKLQRGCYVLTAITSFILCTLYCYCCSDGVVVLRSILTSLLGRCFVYCNGLMDHLCVCENGNSKVWYKAHYVMAVPVTVVYFTCYDQLCVAQKVRLGDHSDKAALFAGAIARVGSVTVISPLELIRTKLQFQKQSYRELSAYIRSAVEAGGWLSLWRGWGPTLLKDVPFSAMYWYNYERGKAWMCDNYSTTEPTFTITFLSSTVSGSIASKATLPFDVVKDPTAVASCRTSCSTWNVVSRIVAENGIRGLFAGGH